MTKFRDGLIGPTLILLTICLIIAVALAAVYNQTAPVIAAGEIAAANDARKLVLAEADSFTQVSGVELPENVVDAYKADNGAGYVFTSQAKGFDGFVTWIIGVDADGGIVGINMFAHNETPGLGTKVEAPEYMDQYFGDADPDAVDAITGVTRTSNSLKNALKQAKAAYELMK